MYYYGGGVGCGQNQATSYYCPCSKNNSSTNNYAIILVLFILLVIIIGCRWTN